MILSNIQSIGLAGLTMVVLGGAFAVVLLIASIKLKVVLDPKIEAVHAALPNIDCGACGFAGCASYAKAKERIPDSLSRFRQGRFVLERFYYHLPLYKPFLQQPSFNLLDICIENRNYRVTGYRRPGDGDNFTVTFDFFPIPDL